MTESELEEISAQAIEFQRCVRDGDDADFAFKDDPCDLVIRLLGEVKRLRNACGDMLLSEALRSSDFTNASICREIGCSLSNYGVVWK